MELTIRTNKREEIVDITSDVKEAISKLWGQEKKMVCNKGSKACLVYTPHATCAVIVNENYDEAVCQDIIDFLRKQIPQGGWKHDKIDDNADSHIKASIMGPSQLIPVQDGELLLGRWQGIGLAEFDGPRQRKVMVKIL
jgi:secondary thiamine-phosphate synthase enzyme